MASTTTARSASALPWGALGLLAVLIFAWGGNYTWISLALHDVGPWTFTAVRYVGAAIVVGMALAVRGGPAHIMPVRGERMGLAAIGMLQGAALTILLTLSLQWIESTHTILLMYTNPLWALLWSVLLLGERFSFASVAGIALGLLGMAILTNPLAMPWNAVTIPGVIYALVATIAWALGSVLYRRTKWESTFWQQVFWQLAVSGIAVAIPAIMLEWHHPIRLTPQLIVNTIYNILVPTALAFWCWSQALTRIRASTASQILLLSPVFGIVQSHFVLGEPLTPAVLASAACVIAGACLTFWRPAAAAR
ncbi:MAG: DMT family transporter [Hyphomicrobiales bacterium]|nr:DMT family transporter [Hyphomicrobiales bacterium]MBV8826746.1 DMT family transporter [Hyphomicrobiales bacterium]